MGWEGRGDAGAGAVAGAGGGMGVGMVPSDPSLPLLAVKLCGFQWCSRVRCLAAQAEAHFGHDTPAPPQSVSWVGLSTQTWWGRC